MWYHGASKTPKYAENQENMAKKFSLSVLSRIVGVPVDVLQNLHGGYDCRTLVVNRKELTSILSGLRKIRDRRWSPRDTDLHFFIEYHPWVSERAFTHERTHPF